MGIDESVKKKVTEIPNLIYSDGKGIPKTVAIFHRHRESSVTVGDEVISI